MEYKEWALAEGYIPQKLDSVYGFDEAKEYFNKYELVNPIHVIEFSAFEKLKKQNEIMRETLSFYANGDNWNHIEPGTHYVTNIYQCVDKEDYGDGDFIINKRMNIDDCGVGGKRARQALKDVEGVG